MHALLARLARWLPPHTHPLTLLSDPDGVLDAPELHAALRAQGFRLLVDDPDNPQNLALALAALPAVTPQGSRWSSAHPLVIITPQPIETLPATLVQQGHAVTLELDQLFPRLDYIPLRDLSVAHYARLAAAYASGLAPIHPLNRADTIASLFAHCYPDNPTRIRTPSALLRWLYGYHETAPPPLPLIGALRRALLEHLQSLPAFSGWDVAALLDDPATYQQTMQQLLERTVRHVCEQPDQPYTTAAAATLASPDLRPLLPALLASGVLTPVPLPFPTRTPADIPAWLQQSVVAPSVQHHLEALHPLLLACQPTSPWAQWQPVAQHWAQVVGQLARQPDAATALREQVGSVRHLLDQRFLAWVQANYARLQSYRLPTPHHLYHIPGWLAAQVEQTPTLRPALLILDGLSLALWQQLALHWRATHPTWQLKEQLVLAQIPTITAVSRQALISGKPPRQFAKTLQHNRHEAQHWKDFWQQHGQIGGYARLQLTQDLPDVAYSNQTQAVCLVLNDLDEIVHSSTLGLSGVFAAYRIWLEQPQGAAQLAKHIEQLFNLGYTVAITSDHGHIEAIGMGIPQEGVRVETRSKRVRLYAAHDAALVERVQQAFAATLWWQNDGVLPAEVIALVAREQHAFAHQGTLVVSHGGISLEELVVPLITITRANQ